MFLAKLPFKAYRIVLLALAFTVLVASILTWTFFGLHLEHGDFGSIGIGSYTTSNTAVPCSRTLVSVVDGSPLALAGVRAGDQYCFDREIQRGMDLLSGEQVGLLVTHAGQTRHLDLSAVTSPLSARRAVYALVNPLVSLVTTMIGLLIGLRGGQRSDLRSLGLGLVLIGLVEPTSMPDWAAAPFTFIYLLYVLGPLYIFDFVLRFPDKDVGPWRKRFAYLRPLGPVVAIAMVAVSWANRFTHWSGNVVNAMEGTYLLTLGVLIGIVVVIGRIEAAGEARARFNWLLPAFMSLGVGSFFTLVPPLPAEFDGWITLGIYLLTLVFPVGLAYGTLKHRVFDFGFAINRALVYTVTTTILLVVFSLTEFAVDKLLHFHGREANIVIDAVVALGVILTFHRIQHWVGHRIDHLFYHDWKEAAGRLEMFINSSIQITQAGILMERFVVALDQFIRPGGTAIYLRQVDGAYHLAQASLAGVPATIDIDDESVVELRHAGKVITVVAGAASGAASLAIPMSVHGLLDGFILLAEKPNGAAFRSDELKSLSAAADRLMGNLEFLRVKQLDRDNADLKDQIRQLRQSAADSKTALQAAEHARIVAELKLAALRT
ncbi:MAG: hypothetical protein ACXWC4_13350, partial [Telluria sp.]